MKFLKKVILLISTLLILAPIPVSAAAVGQASGSTYSNGIYDGASLLSDSEIASLAERISGIKEKVSSDIVVVTTLDTDGKSNMDYADDFYDEGGFGIGDDNDGILLLINMGEGRGMWISTCGAEIKNFSDRRIDEISDRVVGYLADGDYAAGISVFLDMAERTLIEEHGNYDYIYENQNREPSLINKVFPSFTGDTRVVILGSLAIGLIAALITTLIMKGGMNRIHTASGARACAVRDSFRLTRESDYFLYSTVSKTVRETQSSSGSSFHTSSGGVSHGGGGRSF